MTTQTDVQNVLNRLKTAQQRPLGDSTVQGPYGA